MSWRHLNSQWMPLWKVWQISKSWAVNNQERIIITKVCDSKYKSAVFLNLSYYVPEIALHQKTVKVPVKVLPTAKALFLVSIQDCFINKSKDSTLKQSKVFNQEQIVIVWADIEKLLSLQLCKYSKVARSRPVYYWILNSFDQSSQYIQLRGN